MVHTKKYLGTPFTVTCSAVQNEPGTWDSTKVSIYKGENLIGEYIRNYSDYGALTFYPFQLSSQWYALYSPHYTATRVMKIHDDRIEDWCGEIEASHGFCPVEFYVPRYNQFSNLYESKDGPRTFLHYSVDSDCKNDQEFIDEWKEESYVNTSYCDFGFLCGCVWGDDTSWKLRHIDLTGIHGKELLITEKFGYWELPTNLTLKQCINMEGWEPGHHWISLTKMETINFDTGERS